MGPERFNSQAAIYQDALDASEEKRVAEWYNNLSHSYDELYGHEQSFKQEKVLDFMYNKRFGILVDVGCGSGAFLDDAVSFYDYAIGIDLSINMLKAARKKRSSKHDVVLATSRALPMRNGIADCLVSISTLKADSTLPANLRELRRLLNGEALLAVSLFQEPGGPRPFDSSEPFQSSRISNRESIYFFTCQSGRQPVSKTALG